MRIGYHQRKHSSLKLDYHHHTHVGLVAYGFPMHPNRHLTTTTYVELAMIIVQLRNSLSKVLLDFEIERANSTGLQELLKMKLGDLTVVNF